MMIPGIMAQRRVVSGGPISAYWIAMLGGAGNDSSTTPTPVIDASGNIYGAGLTASIGAGGNDIVLFKLSPAGSVIWQRTLGGAGSDTAYSVALDSSGAVYVAGSTDSQGAGLSELLLAKYSNSGVLQWQRSLGGAGNEFGAAIAISSGDAIYVAGTTNPGVGSGDMLLARYSTSGTIQWQVRLGGASSEAGNGVTVDSSGNVYICGFSGSTGSGSLDAIIAKYNSAGALQWQRSLSAAGTDIANGVVADSFGGVCVVGNTDSQGAGANDLLISKYNSSGALQWQRSLGGAGNEYGFRITTDSAGDFYVAGRSDAIGAGLSELLLAKYSNSGVLQWQRSLGGAGNEFGTGIALGPSGEMCVLGRTESAGAGGQDIIVARLPSDGSMTGTYGSFTYAATSLADAARTLTDSAVSLTAANAGLTDAARTLTDAAGTLTSTLISL